MALGLSGVLYCGKYAYESSSSNRCATVDRSELEGRASDPSFVVVETRSETSFFPPNTTCVIRLQNSDGESDQLEIRRSWLL